MIKKDETLVAILMELFNMWLAYRALPERVQGSRTILIPKKGDPAFFVASNLNWGNIGENLWSCIGTKNRRMCSHITKATSVCSGMWTGDKSVYSQ